MQLRCHVCLVFSEQRSCTYAYPRRRGHSLVALAIQLLACRDCVHAGHAHVFCSRCFLLLRCGSCTWTPVLRSVQQAHARLRYLTIAVHTFLLTGCFSFSTRGVLVPVFGSSRSWREERQVPHTEECAVSAALRACTWKHNTHTQVARRSRMSSLGLLLHGREFSSLLQHVAHGMLLLMSRCCCLGLLAAAVCQRMFLSIQGSSYTVKHGHDTRQHLAFCSACRALQ